MKQEFMGPQRWPDFVWLILFVFGALALRAQPIPEITQQPESQFVQLGENAVFQLSAVGQDPLTYKWWRRIPPSSDWVSLSDGGRISGADTPTLTISNAQLADQANYWGLVYDRQNDIGYSDIVDLTIVYPPSITQHPADQTVTVGDTAQFVSGADGTAPMTYRWQFNGEDIPGIEHVSGPATLTLTYSNAQLAGAGEYRMVVTNAYGWAASSNALLTVGEPPVIVQPPTNQTVIAGITVTFDTVAAGTDPLSYRWRKNEVDLIDGGPISGAGTASLMIQNVQDTDAGGYSVLVTNDHGAVVSTQAFLTVLVPAAIAQPPESTNLYVGEPFSFSAAVTGTPPLDVQWLFNSTNLPGETSLTYSRTAAALGDAGEYALVVTNLYGAETSSPAILTVLDSAPVVQVPPESRVLYAGTDHTLEVVAAGSKPFSYAWSFDGLPLPGETNATLLIPNLDDADTGSYAVTISNRLGVAEASALISVQSVVKWGGSTDLPSTLTNVVAISANGPKVALRGDGTVVVWGEAGQASSLPPGASNMVSVTAGDQNFVLGIREDGRQFAWGFNQYGQATVPENLGPVVINAAGIFHSFAVRVDGTPVHWGATGQGQAAFPEGLSNIVAAHSSDYQTLVAKADGTISVWGAMPSGYVPPPAGLSNVVDVASGWSHNIALKRGGSVVAWGVNWGGQVNVPAAISNNVVAVDAKNNSSLALLDNGHAVWWGYNQGGPLTVPTGLSNVMAIALGYNEALALVGRRAPEVYQTPFDRSALLGSSTLLRVSAVGTQPLSYQWMHDGMNISGATDRALLLSNLDYTNSGIYSVAISNVLGQTVSSHALLSVVSLLVKAEPKSQSVVLGSNALFNAEVASVSPVDLRWHKDGLALVDDGRTSGATSNTLSILNVQTNDAGSYELVASNATTVITSAVATLTVLVPPTFVLNPTDQTLIAGTNVTLAAVVTGTGPIGYQWYRGTTPVVDDGRITGATTASLSISNLETDDAGAYTVQASGPGGDATSAPAVLTVYLLPSVLSAPTNQTAPAGMNVSFSVTTGGTLPLAYQWRFDGLSIPGANVSLLTLTNVQAGNMGGYEVVVTNAYGAVTSAVATLTVIPSAPTLTLEPRSLVASIGQDVLLSSSALGTDPIVYQWQRDAVDLPGENGASLNLHSVDGSHRGGYRVIASNEVGTATSSNALLSVVPVIVWGRTNDKSGGIPASATNIVAITAAQTWSSRSQTLAVHSDGSIESWGQGFEDVTSAEATNIVAIAAGEDARVPAHKLAVTADGDVLAWGYDYLGRTNVPATATNAVAVAAGEYHSLALRGDGSVIAWGDNSRGQSTVPGSATNVVAIAAGVRHSLALRADGTVVGWGYNSFGQVSVFSNATGIVSIAAAGNQSLGLHADGSVAGVVITNILFNQQSLYGSPPTNLTGVKAIAAGSRNTLYLRGDTMVSVEGWNTYGEKNPPPHVTNVTAIAAGSYHGVALVRDQFAPIPPYMGRQPMARTVTAGESFVIHSLALGSLPINCEWQLGGMPVPGQTNPWLYLTNVHPRQAGDYVMVASNEFGSMTSAVATVTVVIPQPALHGQGVNTNGFSFTFKSIAQVLYVIEYTDALGEGPWIELERLCGSGGTEVVTDPDPGSSTRFYRVRAVYAPSPQLVMVSFGSAVGLNVQTVVGPRYVVEYKDALGDPAWIEMQTRVGTGGIESFVDPGPLPASRFYRVRVR